MIDFQNAAFFKLHPAKPDAGEAMFQNLLVQNEQVIQSFKGIRDMVIFTNLRIIAINVQGITGKKKDFTSIPYSKLQTFSVETSGTFDLDCELEVYISGVGKVKFEFTGGYNIATLAQFISTRIL
ncbi:MAG: PH domain-containing protein [Clostridia bacterium]|nr:PH domain-containing protein [Clostridia bacterium]